LKSIFLTLGWQTTAALSAIVRHGLSNGDEIIVIVPHIKDSAAEKAVSEIETFLKNLGNIKFKELTIDISNFIDSVIKIKSILDEKTDKSCIVNLSGGMRVLVLITYLACLLSKNKNIHIELETEDRKHLIISESSNFNIF